MSGRFWAKVLGESFGRKFLAGFERVVLSGVLGGLGGKRGGFGAGFEGVVFALGKKCHYIRFRDSLPPPPPLFATFFEKDLRGRLHVRPLVFFWGSFPTMSVLKVFGCLERCDSLLFEPRRRSVAQGLLATARGSKFLAFRKIV